MIYSKLSELSAIWSTSGHEAVIAHKTADFIIPLVIDMRGDLLEEKKH